MKFLVFILALWQLPAVLSGCEGPSCLQKPVFLENPTKQLELNENKAASVGGLGNAMEKAAKELITKKKPLSWKLTPEARDAANAMGFDADSKDFDISKLNPLARQAVKRVQLDAIKDKLVVADDVKLAKASILSRMNIQDVRSSLAGNSGLQHLSGGFATQMEGDAYQDQREDMLFPGVNQVGVGFNVFDGSMRLPLFKVESSLMTPVIIGGCPFISCVAPGWIAVTENSEGTIGTKMTVFANAHEYEKAKASMYAVGGSVAGFGTVGGVPVMASGSMSFSKDEEETKARQTKGEGQFAVSTFQFKLFHAAVHPVAVTMLDDIFRDDLIRLLADPHYYHKMIPRWGTHYIAECDLGGDVIVELSANASSAKKYTKEQFQQAAEAEVSIATLGIGVKAKGQQQKGESEQNGGIDFLKHMSVDMKVHGGRPDYFNRDRIVKWATSVRFAPVPVQDTIRYVPIENLLDDFVRQSGISVLPKRVREVKHQIARIRLKILRDEDPHSVGLKKENAAQSCQALKHFNGAQATSGMYWVTNGQDQPQHVYCDMVSNGGGWTLLGFAWHGRLKKSLDANTAGVRRAYGRLTNPKAPWESATVASTNILKNATSVAITFIPSLSVVAGEEAEQGNERIADAGLYSTLFEHLAASRRQRNTKEKQRAQLEKMQFTGLVPEFLNKLNTKMYQRNTKVNEEYSTRVGRSKDVPAHRYISLNGNFPKGGGDMHWPEIWCQQHAEKQEDAVAWTAMEGTRGNYKKWACFIFFEFPFRFVAPTDNVGRHDFVKTRNRGETPNVLFQSVVSGFTMDMMRRLNLRKDSFGLEMNQWAGAVVFRKGKGHSVEGAHPNVLKAFERCGTKAWDGKVPQLGNCAYGFETKKCSISVPFHSHCNSAAAVFPGENSSIRKTVETFMSAIWAR